MRAVNFPDHEKIPATAGSRGRISPGGYGLRYCRPAMLVLLAVVLLLAAPKAGAAGPGVISGRLLTTAGEPVAADTVVLFFNVKNGPPPAPGVYWRIPDEGGPVRSDGRFAVALPAGSYYFGAIHRSQKKKGFPGLEDWVYLGADAKGGPRQYRIKDGDRLSLGDISVPAVFTWGSTSQVPVVRLTGRILSMDGLPLAGMLVEAWSVAQPRAAWPLFSSHRSREDGSYSLIMVPGEYLLRVRQGAGPGTASKEFRPALPFADGSVSRRLEVRKDETLDITVRNSSGKRGKNSGGGSS